jgi:pSer/pThr/pTyr-binding forkhead associated (FHA) protein
LSAETDKARAALGKASVEIRAFPFRIGRKLTQSGSDAFSLNDLYLADEEPFNISRNHCAIDMMPNGLYVVEDRGSTLGTRVNGELVGSQAEKFEAFLANPVNTLVLGSESSPFRFSLKLQ